MERSVKTILSEKMNDLKVLQGYCTHYLMPSACSFQVFQLQVNHTVCIILL